MIGFNSLRLGGFHISNVVNSLRLADIQLQAMLFSQIKYKLRTNSINILIILLIITNVLDEFNTKGNE